MSGRFRIGAAGTLSRELSPPFDAIRGAFGFRAIGPPMNCHRWRFAESKTRDSQ
jgi:hypothetical protein